MAFPHQPTSSSELWDISAVSYKNYPFAACKFRKKAKNHENAHLSTSLAHKFYTKFCCFSKFRTGHAVSFRLLVFFCMLVCPFVRARSYLISVPLLFWPRNRRWKRQIADCSLRYPHQYPKPRRLEKVPGTGCFQRFSDPPLPD